MAVEDVSRIRNVAIVGQGGVGKTTLADAAAFACGLAPRVGRIEDGSSLFAHEPEEAKHRVSLSASVATMSWRKHEVTIVDTPGYANFLAETHHALRIVDGAIVVVPPSGPLKVELERVWAWAGEEHVPAIAFVSHLDHEAVDLESLLDRLSALLHVPVVSLTLPLGSGAELAGTVDLLHERVIRPAPDGAAPKSEPIPAALAESVAAARKRLVETIAESSDELLERYLESGDLGEEDLVAGLRAGLRERKLLPVVTGAPLAGVGVASLLDLVVDELPSPVDRGPVHGPRPKTGEDVERAADLSAPLSAQVFKTTIDPFAGKLSIFRVWSGTVNADSFVLNATRDAREHVGHLFRLEGRKQVDVREVVAGEIAAVAKLKDTGTGDTLAAEKDPIVLPALPETPSSISFAIEPRSKGDEEKANQALARLVEEDPALHVHRDPQTREILLSGAGQLHVEVTVERLKRKFGVDVELKSPKVPYRETIKGKASAQGKYKKQSGGRGQYGDCWLEVEPLPRGRGFEFVDKVVGGAIPRNFIPAVEKGIREAMSEGFVAGFPLEDLRVTVYDGSFHVVDSSEMAFKIAGSIGFKAAVEKARAILLEPVMRLAITVPSESLGDVIGDLNSRRGKVSGVEPQDGEQAVRGLVPMAEVLRYAPDLRSLTSGRGQFTMELDHYDEVPAMLVPKILEATKAARSGGHA